MKLNARRRTASRAGVAPVGDLLGCGEQLEAEIFSPLRSKRAITSPVRLRSKVSGLTRIRSGSTAGSFVCSWSAWSFCRRAAGGPFAGALFGGPDCRGLLSPSPAVVAASAGRAFCAYDVRAPRRSPLFNSRSRSRSRSPSGGLASARLAGALSTRQRGLAERGEAHRRGRLRFAAGRAGVLEGAVAVRPTQVVPLDRVLAVGAGRGSRAGAPSSAAWISSSRSWASSRNSGGRTIM